jgi:hypothetical protein
LDFHKTKRAVHTASAAQVRKKCTRAALMPGENSKLICSH